MGQNGEFGTVYQEERLSEPTNELLIQRPADSIIQKKTIVLYLWYQDYVIHDYDFHVKPEDCLPVNYYMLVPGGAK